MRRRLGETEGILERKAEYKAEHILERKGGKGRRWRVIYLRGKGAIVKENH